MMVMKVMIDDDNGGARVSCSGERGMGRRKEIERMRVNRCMGGG